MFGIGTPELIVILVIALIFLGPRRLPEVGKALGKALGELRRASQDLRDSIEIETRRSEHAERVASAQAGRSIVPYTVVDIAHRLCGQTAVLVARPSRAARGGCRPADADRLPYTAL